MDNYDHEIECPQNKAIINYLWYDYFHDSTIHKIEFDHKKGLVILTLESCRDLDEKWEKLKGTFEERSLYVDKHRGEFTYILCFKGVQYFHDERLIMANDYLNGRFKNTALLCKLKAETKKSLYQFRMQIDDGYIDIIFSDFQIRKKVGRVKYSVSEVFYQAESSSLIEKDITLTGKDFDRFLFMQKLYKAKDESLLKIARESIRFGDDSEDSCLYSAYLLGKYGDTSDIKNLFGLYLNIEEHLIAKSVCRCSAILPKRNILDAIELIQLRSE